MKPINVVVVGGGYAGMYAAGRVARLRKQVNVTLVEPKTHFVQRIRLHQVAAGGQIKTFHYGTMLKQRGITWLQGVLTHSDFDQKQLQIETANGNQTVTYDYLIYAIGSQVTTPTALSGISDQQNPVFNLNSLASSQALHSHLAQKHQANVLVVGAGLAGIELSSELATQQRHCKVSLLDRSAVFSNFSPAAQEHFLNSFSKMGINLIQGELTAFSQHQAALADGSKHNFDTVVWCGGMENPTQRWPVNDFLQLPNHPNVFVVGDASVVKNADGSAIRMGCVGAIPMGVYAGEAVISLIQNQTLTPFEFAFPMRCISLGRHNGVIQFTRFNDGPKDSILKGRAAALVKELICKMTFELLRLEYKTGWRCYQWAKPSAEELEQIQTRLTENP